MDFRLPARRLVLPAALILYILTGMTTVSGQITRFVSTTGTAAASAATSWAASTTNLQGAIDYVAANGGGAVWVARGTYKPTVYTGPDSRTVSFSMKNNVTVYGGFNGNEADLSLRPAINPVNGQPSGSTLSGEIGDPASLTDNSQHVISNPGSLTTSAVLNGFVITGGYAVSTPDTRGGAVYNNGRETGQYCHPVFVNCTFSGNTAEVGGAMANEGTSSPRLTNCLFQHNNALLSYGGAMYNNAINGGDSSPTLTGCSFQSNTATSHGGAIYNSGLSGSSSPRLTGCSFQQNVTKSMGGAVYNLKANSVLTDCSFQSNTATAFGGAICSDFSGGVSSLSVTGSSFADNVAQTSGGALFLSGIDTWLINCSFLHNTADSQGGGLSIDNGSLLLANCSFIDNTGFWGGAINLSNLSGNVHMTGCSFQQNTGTNLGGVFYAYKSDLEPTDCIFWKNGDGNSFYLSSSTLTASYSLFEPTSLTTGVTVSGPGNLTNVTTSPFQSTTSATLRTCSPALNAGNPASITIAGGPFSATALPGTDVAGNPRIIGGRVDMGAAELQLTPVVAITSSPPAGSALCPGRPVSASAGVSGTADSYQWYKNGSILATQTSAALFLSALQQSDAGNYAVVITGACNSVTSTVFSLTVNAVPSVSIASGLSSVLTCDQPTLTLTATSSATALRWITSQTTAAISVSTTGTYSVTATGTNGCTAVSNNLAVSQYIALPPDPSILSFTADESACPVRLTGRGIASSFTMTGPKNYVFSTVYREGAAREAVGLNVTQAGTYTLTATYTNSCGTSAPVIRTVTVNRNCP